jgi:RimJ/RimL family protein N-acetyltransferase
MTLRVVSVGPSAYAALRQGGAVRGHKAPEGGVEPEETLRSLESLARDLRAAQGWGTFLALLDGEVVASLAVKRPVEDGVAEIGYGVAPSRRGKGIGTAAVGLLCEALAERGVRVVTAETAVENAASIRVMEKAGFRRVGAREDEADGALILWERALA